MSTVYGLSSNGNKKEELPRERKDLERDIFLPLGKYMFRRAYRMKKASFYKLHSLLKPLPPTGHGWSSIAKCYNVRAYIFSDTGN